MGIVIFVVAVSDVVRYLVLYENHKLLTLAMLRTRQEFPMDGAMFCTLPTVLLPLRLSGLCQPAQRASIVKIITTNIPLK
jgi:hypothetical protein